MRQLKFVSMVFSCLLLTACGGNEAEARKAVLDILKDPDSAKFGQFTQIGKDMACLTVNARSSMGGYTGNQQAILRKEDGKWSSFHIHDAPHDTCIKVAQEMAEKAKN